jgi:two-component system sensor histidine kinase KdpD
VAGKAPASLSPTQSQLLETFVAQTALALERSALAHESRRAVTRADEERLRSTLLSSVSHDLRTPLASITGSASALLEPDSRLDPAAQRELLETIRSEGERLGQLVSDLLDLTRLEAGAVRVRKEWVPLEELIACAMIRLGSALDGRDVKIDLPREVLLVSVDPVLMEQAIHNVLDNVAVHTPAGTPVDVRVTTTLREIDVEVADRGPGIPQAEMERIFERFYRGASASGKETTGLGLAIVRAILRSHGGVARAEAREGGGASFHLVFPRGEDAPVVEEGGEADA